MSACWVELITVDQVVDARDAGQVIEFTAGPCAVDLPRNGEGWIDPSHLHDRKQIIEALKFGARYRAMSPGAS
jgi:hypothetical protein